MRVVRRDNERPDLESPAAIGGGGAKRRKREAGEAVLATIIGRHLINLNVISVSLIILTLIMATP